MASRLKKLRVELVPEPLWGRNLRSREGLGKKRWTTLRSKLLKTEGARCAICGSTKSLHGHEIWIYREKRTVGTAVLLGIKIVCVDCHDIHHFARTTKLFQFGIISPDRYAALRRHFRKVNGCSQREFDDHFLRSLRIWSRRSKKKWKIDWGPFEDQVEVARAAREKWAQSHGGHSVIALSPAS